MDNEPEPRESRQEEIRQRLEALHTRIDELKAQRQHDDATLAAASEQLASAQRHVAASQTAADEAVAASVRAFGGAAEAHEHAASSMNEPQRQDPATRTSTSGKQRSTGQLPWQTGSEPNVPGRCSRPNRPMVLADQALDRLVSLAGRHAADLLPPPGSWAQVRILPGRPSGRPGEPVTYYETSGCFSWLARLPGRAGIVPGRQRAARQPMLLRPAAAAGRLDPGG